MKLDETKHCELCDKPRVKGERYCPRHRASMLKKMEDDGYFVETNELTVFEYERLQNERRRGERKADALEEMMDRLDSYRDRENESSSLA